MFLRTIKNSIMRCYYDIKYPYMEYNFTGIDGRDYIMFSVPPIMLANEYQKIFNTKPKTFFDCGAATGAVVDLAIHYGLDAYGIDIVKYPDQHQSWFYMRERQHKWGWSTASLKKLFDNGRIKIKSILDCEPITADIAYCNGTLTYFDEQTLPIVLSKFQKVGMLCAIHNTTEDINAAKQMGETLGTCNEPRTIRTNDWWIETFFKNNFDAHYNAQLRTFLAIPRQK